MNCKRYETRSATRKRPLDPMDSRALDPRTQRTQFNKLNAYMRRLEEQRSSSGSPPAVQQQLQQQNELDSIPLPPEQQILPHQSQPVPSFYLGNPSAFDGVMDRYIQQSSQSLASSPSTIPIFSESSSNNQFATNHLSQHEMQSTASSSFSLPAMYYESATPTTPLASNNCDVLREPPKKKEDTIRKPPIVQGKLIITDSNVSDTELFIPNWSATAHENNKYEKNSTSELMRRMESAIESGNSLLNGNTSENLRKQQQCSNYTSLLNPCSSQSYNFSNNSMTPSSNNKTNNESNESCATANKKNPRRLKGKISGKNINNDPSSTSEENSNGSNASSNISNVPSLSSFSSISTTTTINSSVDNIFTLASSSNSSGNNGTSVKPTTSTTKSSTSLSSISEHNEDSDDSSVVINATASNNRTFIDVLMEMEEQEQRMENRSNSNSNRESGSDDDDIVEVEVIPVVSNVATENAGDMLGHGEGTSSDANVTEGIAHRLRSSNKQNNSLDHDLLELDATEVNRSVRHNSDELARLLQSTDDEERKRGSTEAIELLSSYRRQVGKIRNRLVRINQTMAQNDRQLEQNRKTINENDHELAALRNRIRHLESRQQKQQQSSSSASTSAVTGNADTKAQEHAQELNMKNLQIDQLRNQINILNSQIDNNRNTVDNVEQLRRDLDQLRDQLQCVVCQDAKRDTIFMPCCHFICCEECAKGQQQCSICRGQIRGRITAFMS